MLVMSRALHAHELRLTDGVVDTRGLSTTTRFGVPLQQKGRASGSEPPMILRTILQRYVLASCV